MVELTAEEQRVLGCLIEKEATTPEQYPLSMNALVLACNQTSNREPVVAYPEAMISAALTSLREKQLTRVVHPAHARVTKYRHALGEAWALTPQELAVIAILLLRGPQTRNELRTRTERYADFEDLGGVDGVLDRLAGRPEPMVVGLGRQPGQREERYAHLLAGGPDPRMATASLPAADATQEVGARDRRPDLDEQVAELRREVARLRNQVERLLES